MMQRNLILAGLLVCLSRTSHRHVVLRCAGCRASAGALLCAVLGADMAVWGVRQASKSVSKRKREEAAGEQTEREAKALKREMRRRGHVVGLRGLPYRVFVCVTVS